MLDIPNMVMIGGNSRNAGKTTLACNIIRKLSATHRVIALKVTSIRPGEKQWHGTHNEDDEASFSIFEEHDLQSGKDTSKMFRAGASKVYYIRAADNFTEEAVVQFIARYGINELIVCESRSLRNIVIPGLFVMMIKTPESDNAKNVAVYLDKANFKFNYSLQQQELLDFHTSLYFDNGKFRFEKAKHTT